MLLQNSKAPKQPAKSVNKILTGDIFRLVLNLIFLGIVTAINCLITTLTVETSHSKLLYFLLTII